MKATETVKLEADIQSQNYAKIYASLIKDEKQRKRAYASLVALYAFINYAESTGIQVKNSMTLFRNPAINEKYEISDVYLNERHLDVRVLTGGDAVLIPRIHISADILPEFYVVVRTDKDFENLELLGFIETSEMKAEPYDYRYSSVSLNPPISF